MKIWSIDRKAPATVRPATPGVFFFDALVKSPARAAATAPPNNLYKGSQTFVSFTAMKIVPRIILLLLLTKYSNAFSADLCTKVCSVSTTLCWLCSAVHGGDQKPLENEVETESPLELKDILRPVSKADLIRKAIQSYESYSRGQRIVGGKPVDQGESPWTVR